METCELMKEDSHVAKVVELKVGAQVMLTKNMLQAMPHLLTHALLPIYMYICIHLSVYICTYMYIYRYIQKYTYVQIHTDELVWAYRQTYLFQFSFCLCFSRQTALV